MVTRRVEFGLGEPDQDVIDEPASALDYLQDVYRGRRAAEHSRMRAAMAALPFKSPKLAVMATSNLSGEDFASMLERAIARSPAIRHQ